MVIFSSLGHHQAWEAPSCCLEYIDRGNLKRGILFPETQNRLYSIQRTFRCKSCDFLTPALVNRLGDLVDEFCPTLPPSLCAGPGGSSCSPCSSSNTENQFPSTQGDHQKGGKCKCLALISFASCSPSSRMNALATLAAKSTGQTKVMIFFFEKWY